MLLTRAPLYSWYCYHFLVRLACVRHAASVDSEPGSNSRLKPDVNPSLTEVRLGLTASALKAQTCLPCENDQAKLDLFSRLACSTLLSKILESGPPERCPFGSRPGLLRQGVLELVAHVDFAFNRIFHRFCANFLNLLNLRLSVNLFSSFVLRPLQRHGSR